MQKASNVNNPINRAIVYPTPPDIVICYSEPLWEPRLAQQHPCGVPGMLAAL